VFGDIPVIGVKVGAEHQEEPRVRLIIQLASIRPAIPNYVGVESR